MVFNTLSFHLDDHAKNFSFMMDKNGEWDISPAYDITYSYGATKEHLCTIKGKRKDFVLQDYLDIAEKQVNFCHLLSRYWSFRAFRDENQTAV